VIGLLSRARYPTVMVYLPQDGGPAHFTWNPAWSAQNRIVVKRKSGFGKFPLKQLADTESAHHST
jgi:hypothetical protein